MAILSPLIARHEEGRLVIDFRERLVLTPENKLKVAIG